MSAMVLNDKEDSPCRLTRDWAVVGVMESGARVPIGVFSCWSNARLAGNAWTASTPKAAQWEAERLYVPITAEETADV